MRLPRLPVALFSAGLALSLLSCSQGGSDALVDATTQCSDGVDNDLDTLTDLADPDCTDAGDNDEFASGVALCQDGLDNDGDGKIDYPDDPGCLVENQNSGEDDDCPSGPDCPQCGNGLDDDGDGATDFAGGDPGCGAASDGDEYSFDPDACGAGTSVSNLPVTGVVSGVLQGSTNNLTAVCGAGTVGTGPEVAYVVTVVRPVRLVASTDFPGTNFDSVLYLRRACSDAATQLACSDDVPGGMRSTLSLDVQPGTYFLVVDAKTPAAIGAYTLVVNQYAGQGESCTSPDDCAPGFFCRSVGGAATTCERPVCSDNRDDDGDTLIDYPLDPGCTTPDDSTEEDPCPGAGCPACGNGLDDDADGQTDYPDDVSCTSAAATSEADCPIETDALGVIVGATTTGTTVGATNQFSSATCQGSTAAPDRVLTLAVRAPLNTLTIDTAGSDFDTVLTLRDGLCAGELACNDDGLGAQSRITLSGLATGNYAVVVDGYSTGSGAFRVNVSGTYANGAACDPTMPMFTCAAGYGCAGPAGSAVCAPAACNDTIDADGDGFPGYPTDPGCTSTSDVDETDDCATNGPMCPACGNGDDDDGDGMIDYPLDPSCTSASGGNEDCATTDPTRNLTTAVLTNQSTTTLANDFDLTCGTDGRDEIFRVIVDHPIDEIRVDTIGSALDTVVAVRRSTCTSFDLQCDDNTAGNGDSEVFLVDPQLGEHFIIVDDRNVASPGTYNLRVQGHYANNGRCNPANVFTCNSGFACSGAAGAEICSPAACNDTVDADGDGLPGYPSDPGCSSTSDGDETDSCFPTPGPGCPACANDVDDDGDGFTDYPMDPACVAASVNSELAPCTSAEPVLVFASPVVGGTTAGHLNDVQLSCGTNGRDDIYRLFVTQPLVTLTVDTLGSDINTALGVRVASCNSTDLACGVGNAGNGDSRVTLSSVAIGEYFLIVDDQFVGTPTTYNLNVSGTLPGGATCSPASTTFVCTPGYSCGGAAGAETCILSACNDTIDQDGDGRVGYPSDPGCVSTADNDESDTCPSGPGCPVCANGLDDDGDTRVDYPLDLGCTAASGTSELECAGELDPLTVLMTMTSTGSTTGASNDFLPSCRAAYSVAPDEVYLLTLPVPVTTLRIDTIPSDLDTTVMLKPASCGTAELGCDDDSGGGLDSLLNVPNLAAATYAIVVDGASNGSNGNYTLNVRGTVAAGQACTSPLFAAGVLVCAGSCNAGVCQ